ncbi:MAG TPA: hypothetical protein EYP59_22690 [Thiotrichaceae bacterium]|nr:hypothetical protein [Thiotrichaceae bacterium]
MKRLILLLCCLLLHSEVFATPKVAVWYDSSSRTVYAVTNAGSPTVYFAGVDWGGYGGCLKNSAYVYSMNFLPEEDISTTVKGSLKAEAKHKDLNLSGFASTETSSSYTRPATYKYNYDGLTSNLHYNVVVVDNDLSLASSGWKPNSQGGCTYKIPDMEIEYLYNEYSSAFGKKQGHPYSCGGLYTCQNFDTGLKIAIRNSDGLRFVYYKPKKSWGWYNVGY